MDGEDANNQPPAQDPAEDNQAPVEDAQPEAPVPEAPE